MHGYGASLSRYARARSSQFVFFPETVKRILRSFSLMPCTRGNAPYVRKRFRARPRADLAMCIECGMLIRAPIVNALKSQMWES